MTIINDPWGKSPQVRLTVTEASTLYNLPNWKLWAAIRAGLLPCQRIFNGRIYLRPDDVETALSQNQGGRNGQ